MELLQITQTYLMNRTQIFMIDMIYEDINTS
jgi:hypothetical protein